MIGVFFLILGNGLILAGCILVLSGVRPEETRGFFTFGAMLVIGGFSAYIAAQGDYHMHTYDVVTFYSSTEQGKIVVVYEDEGAVKSILCQPRINIGDTWQIKFLLPNHPQSRLLWPVSPQYTLVIPRHFREGGLE